MRGKLRRSRFLRALIELTLLLALSGCGGQQNPEKTRIQQESAEDELIRISPQWVSTVTSQTLLSPPSEISVRSVTRTSVLTFAEGRVMERLEIRELAELRQGQRVECSLNFEHPLQERFGRQQGRAAVELLRPALKGTRRCNGPYPAPSFSEDPLRALLILRSDELIVERPALDERRYLPRSL